MVNTSQVQEPVDNTRFSYLLALLQAAARDRPSSIDGVRHVVAKEVRSLVSTRGNTEENYRESFNKRTIDVSADEFYALILEALSGTSERLANVIRGVKMYTDYLKNESDAEARFDRVLHDLRVAESSSGLHRCWGIYVGNEAHGNFALARQHETWGSDDTAAFLEIQIGDRILFVHSIASDLDPKPRGFPRVELDKFSGLVDEIVYAEVVGAPYVSDKSLWSNALYPARFAFREVSTSRSETFSTKTFPAKIVEAVRKSAISKGVPRVAEVPDYGPWARGVPVLTARDDPKAIVSAFSSALRDAHLFFGAADEHDDVVRRFMTSLMTKPFVILTGLSGSGKTQIAIKLGEWFGSDRWQIIPVRPDWTGPESLLGYEDALRKPSADGRRAWTVPAALEFMLRAAQDAAHPYLLILDEMNLAHVERYFADVLSGMESRSRVLPNLESVDGSMFQRADRPLIPLPKNLMIVGTVNIDETTYLFSPKVLDRANTLEFRVPTASLPTTVNAMARPIPCQPGDAALVRGMLSIAIDDNWHASHATADTETAATLMRSVHEGLCAFNAEFGHRTFYEGLRLTTLMHAAGATSIDDRLDVFVLQKVLPRLNGARRKLEPVLRGLGAFTFDHRKPGEWKNLKDFTFDGEATAQPRLRRSFAKLQRMMRALQTNQFASFSD
ncbi:MAG: AAA family ATPase [Deltaproteobacteria bacterium]|nr:AAA family ATPase [Deltaproteobacteria bacterium]